MAILLLGVCHADLIGETTPTPKPDATLTRLVEGNKRFVAGSPNRTSLSAQPWEPHLDYINTWMGDVSGGMGQGATYKGHLILSIKGNLDQAIGWKGASVFASGINTHGDSLSGRFVGDSLGTRKDDENPCTHLFEFGLEQSMFSERVAFKLGQLAATSDFFQSASGFFTHNSLNWGPNGQSSAPGGPDSSIGARLQIQFAPSAYVKIGVYDNSTSGDFGHDENDKHGTKWAVPLGDRAVSLVEIGYTPDRGFLNNPSVFKVGAWRDQATHADNLGGPAHGGNWGLFLVAEQVVWTEKADSKEGIRIFGRFAYAPEDRNQLNWQFNAGMLYTGLFPGRGADVMGIAFTHAATSASWRTATGAGANEEAIELKYQFALARWWHLDLFSQYVINPGSPDARHLDNAVVLGIGSHLAF